MTTTVSVQCDATCRLHRAAEGHQTFSAQDQPCDMTIGAVLRVLEAETALEAESAVVASPQTKPGGVYGMVDQLHPGRAAGVAAEQDGLFGSGA